MIIFFTTMQLEVKNKRNVFLSHNHTYEAFKDRILKLGTLEIL